MRNKSDFHVELFRCSALGFSRCCRRWRECAWMKTAESFYAMIEFTDPFPYMTQSEDYIVMCLQTAQRVLFSGEV